MLPGNLACGAVGPASVQSAAEATSRSPGRREILRRRLEAPVETHATSTTTRPSGFAAGAKFRHARVTRPRGFALRAEVAPYPGKRREHHRA